MWLDQGRYIGQFKVKKPIDLTVCTVRAVQTYITSITWRRSMTEHNQ